MYTSALLHRFRSHILSCGCFSWLVSEHVFYMCNAALFRKLNENVYDLIYAKSVSRSIFMRLESTALYITRNMRVATTDLQSTYSRLYCGRFSSQEVTVIYSCPKQFFHRFSMFCKLCLYFIFKLKREREREQNQMKWGGGGRGEV